MHPAPARQPREIPPRPDRSGLLRKAHGGDGSAARLGRGNSVRGVPGKASVRNCQALRTLRPFARRRRMMRRPALVAIRALNPCLRFRTRLLGWNVRFICRLRSFRQINAERADADTAAGRACQIPPQIRPRNAIRDKAFAMSVDLVWYPAADSGIAVPAPDACNRIRGWCKRSQARRFDSRAL